MPKTVQGSGLRSDFGPEIKAHADILTYNFKIVQRLVSLKYCPQKTSFRLGFFVDGNRPQLGSSLTYVLLLLQVGILYFQPSVFRCILLRWVRLLGFATVYGTVTLKLYRYDTHYTHSYAKLSNIINHPWKYRESNHNDLFKCNYTASYISFPCKCKRLIKLFLSYFITRLHCSTCLGRDSMPH